MGIKTMHYMDIMAFNSAVTGSCTLCNSRFPNSEHEKFVVDCGLFQEKANESLNSRMEFNPDSIDFALATHTHVDHIGRFPFMVKHGYRKPIFASEDAANFLAKKALKDCQGVLQANASVKSMPPIYGERDVDETLSLFEGKPFSKSWWPSKRIEATLFGNEHVVGASKILVRSHYDGYEPVNVLFTGDYNDCNTFFSSDPIPDYVKELPLTIVTESTYGTTNSNECEPRFRKRIAEVLSERNDVLLLAYSFGRTQEVLYALKCMQESGELSVDVPIYLDGKLGIEYTKIFPQLGIDEKMKDFTPQNLIFVDKGERENIISSPEKKIVITSSGTGSYGPAQFYLPYFLANPKAYVAFTGYTPENTLGHKLQTVPPESYVKVGGIVIKRRAEVEYFSEFSAHAKADKLIDFLREFKNIKLVLVNHGEPEKKLAFADRVKEEVKPKMVGILDRDYWFRVDQYGYVKSVPTKFL